jgi:hypothetical protein
VAPGVGPQEGDLVEAQGAHLLRPCWVIDQGPAVVLDGGHGGAPTDTEVPGHTGHRSVLLPDLAARLGPGPLGHRRPGRDGRHLLRPGRHLAVGLGAAPDALGPHHHHPPSAGRKVAHSHPAPALRQCPGPTARTPDHRGRRLHQLVQLTVDFGGGQQAEAGHAHKRDGALATLECHQGASSILAASTAARIARPLVAMVDGLALWRKAVPGHAPRFIAKSQ